MTEERYIEWDALADGETIEIAISDPGDLPDGVTSGVIRRQDGKLYLDYRGPLTEDEGPSMIMRSFFSRNDAGQVRRSRGPTLATTHAGTTVEMDILQPGAVTLENNFTALTGTAELLRAVVHVDRHEAASHVTDWVLNYKIAGNYVHSVSTHRESNTEHIRRRADRSIKYSSINRSGTAFDSVNLKLSDGQVLYFGKVYKDYGPQDLLPGFVEFVDVQRQYIGRDERLALLRALSFFLGRELVPVGTTYFDDEWNAIAFSAQSPLDAMSTTKLQRFARPPCHLLRNDHFIDEEALARGVQAFVEADKVFQFVHPLWLVWLADTTAADAQAAHLGAALESLRDMYYRVEEAKSQTRFLPKAHWKPLHQELKALLENRLKALVDADPSLVDQESRELLATKLAALNSRSSNMQYTEFFRRLSLETGEVERAALLERNNPAHGYRYSGDEYTGLIYTIAALRTLVTRVVLRLVGAESYVDYSTVGHPSRPLSDALGGPNGDGVPARNRR